MGLRRARCYRWDSPAFTRVSNNPTDSYVTGVPGLKINRFEMGDPKGDFDYQVSLVSDQNIQIRHNALEAARQTSVRWLEKNLGKKGFFMKIRVYPHHILREHKAASGAGADRVSSGMRQSFGTPVGKAARVKTGQMIVSINLLATKADVGKEALRKANIKMPGTKHVEEKALKKIVKKEE